MFTETYNFIEKHLSGTTPTFSASVKTLGLPLSEWISVSYLIARTYDAIEDCSSVDGNIRSEILTSAKYLVWNPESRKDWLKKLPFIINRAENSIHSGEIALLQENEELWVYVDNLPENILTIIRPHLNFLSDGMAEFARQEKKIGIEGFSTMGALINYCYSVAGVVGVLLTDLFINQLFAGKETDNFDFSQAHALAPSFGFAKQLSNILKNIGDDIKRGICFIPKQLLESEGISAEFIVNNPEDEKSKRLVLKYISFILPNVLRAIEYTKIFINFEEVEREQLAFNIRRALAAQIMLVIKTIANAVQNPSLAFYERKLQLQKNDMLQIISEVMQVSPSSIETDVYLRKELAHLEEMMLNAKIIQSYQ